MAYDRGNGGFRGGFKGGNKFGGASDRRSFTDRGAKPMMFSATCGDCGNRCEVPFKPNGRKPVLCSNCFGPKKDYEQKFEKRDDSFRPSHDNFHASNENAEILRSIGVKLDTIIKLLQSNDLSL